MAASGPTWDPATRLWWEVTNAARRFVVEGHRDDPTASEAPMSYWCIAGRLRLVTTSVGISEEDLASAFDAALFPHVLPHRKLEALTEAARLSLAGLHPDGVETLYDSSTDPTVSIARLPAEALESLIVSLRPLLRTWEHERLGQHVRRLHASDELLLTVARRYEIEHDV